VLSILFSLWFQQRNDSSSIRDESLPLLAEEEQLQQSNLFKSIMMSGFKPCTLSFDVSYSVVDAVAEKKILDGVRGTVEPGQVMALMGGSGAGKTSLMDILARRRKVGSINGGIWVNDKILDDNLFKSIIGYVDQQDTLMDTLTVLETIMYSALLRLPRKMGDAQKRMRVGETMQELGISGIANRRVDGISGGEKRRGMICWCA
jgi:ABC-type multidrug transport system ATPase subunit